LPDNTFNEPRIALNRIYTKQGDAGDTRLAGGQLVSKDSLRIECYGTVDELNSFVGKAALLSAELPRLQTILIRVQHELFNLGSILATLPEDVHPKQPTVTQVEVERLEAEMDSFNEELEPLRSFVLPGGTTLSAELHICRTVCRRAERQLVSLSHQDVVPPDTIKYLNRLSDAFFVWSRWANVSVGAAEVLWQPNRSSSGQA